MSSNDNSNITRHQAVGAYPKWHPPSFDTPADHVTELTVQPTPAVTESATDTIQDDNPHFTPTTDSSDLTSNEQENSDYLSDPINDDHYNDLANETPALTLPTADELEAIYEQARQEGLESGYQEGLDEGRKAGQQQADDNIAQLAHLVQQFNLAIEQINSDIAEETVALAIEIARMLVQDSLRQQPEQILLTVQDALKYLPQKSLTIYLHPQDLAELQAHQDTIPQLQSHQLHPDNTLQRGDCRLEAAGNRLDATLATRWRRILASLGQQETQWQQAEP